MSKSNKPRKRVSGSILAELPPVNPNATPTCGQDECPFCGFHHDRCYCPPRPPRRYAPPRETDHDAKVDAFLNRCDTLADLADEIDFLAMQQEMHNATYPDGSPQDSPFAGALYSVMAQTETYLYGGRQ